MLKDLYRKEPVAILTTLLIVIQAIVEATTVQGYTWQSLVMSAVTALLGLVARQSVFSPNTNARQIFEAKVDTATAIEAHNRGYVPIETDPRTNP